MKVFFYSMKDFEQPYLEKAGLKDHSLIITDKRLTEETVMLSKDCEAICIFTGDDASAPVLLKLAMNGIKFIAIRAAGYDNIDLKKARQLNIKVANVPDYSPHAIAEHAVSLMLALNRNIILANKQVKQYNFSLTNLIGFDMHGKTAGIIGTGRTGSAVASILHGLGCKLVGCDSQKDTELMENFDLVYTDLDTLCEVSDIITIHCNLNPSTKYLINSKLLNSMKRGVMLINTARGAIINTREVLDALESGQVGYLGMDVYEYEQGIFFNDLQGKDQIKDTILQRLLEMPNVLITPHQAFATREALENIATTTFANLHSWSIQQQCRYELNPITKRLLPAVKNEL